MMSCWMQGAVEVPRTTACSCCCVSSCRADTLYLRSSCRHITAAATGQWRSHDQRCVMTVGHQCSITTLLSVAMHKPACTLSSSVRLITRPHCLPAGWRSSSGSGHLTHGPIARLQLSNTCAAAPTTSCCAAEQRRRTAARQRPTQCLLIWRRTQATQLILHCQQQQQQHLQHHCRNQYMRQLRSLRVMQTARTLVSGRRSASGGRPQVCRGSGDTPSPGHAAKRPAMQRPH